MLNCVSNYYPINLKMNYCFVKFYYSIITPCNALIKLTTILSRKLVMISMETLDAVTKTLWILDPLSFIVSIIVYTYILYVTRTKHSTTYLTMIKIIAFINIPFSLQANVMLFYPDSITNPLSNRIITFIGGWSGFTSLWIYLICDMELLKLLYIITPIFTPDRIFVIQIIETVVSFALGGGISR
ncbi:hypothetical protein BC833DRAFT_249485 [Globomyces pollinis-pini]|nr:hypothetical protein BC833DRAFT_249485 [Globomyces pollinis-pini]